MTEPAAARIRRIVGVCLLSASLIALVGIVRSRLLQEIWSSPGWVQVTTLASVGLCGASAIGLLTRRAFGYWCLYVATALYLMTGATVPYVPLVISFFPERLRSGVVALINLSITVLVFGLHYRAHRQRTTPDGGNDRS